jgi:hypothetical protein
MQNAELEAISAELSLIKWEDRNGITEPTSVTIPDAWPLSPQLRVMMEKKDSQDRSIGKHVSGVIASVNQLLSEDYSPERFFVPSGNKKYDSTTFELAYRAVNVCWGSLRSSSLFGATKLFAESFLRVAALYHDIGKTISDDHHVSRGVHLMRDVSETERRAVEALFESVSDRRCFWNVLRHHDTFGTLCTGESSYPALADMVPWFQSKDVASSPFYSPLAQMSLLLWLNVADVNAVLASIPTIRGISTVEAGRYLSDWKYIKDYFGEEEDQLSVNNRENFKRWAYQRAATAEMTIGRITRLIASSYKRIVGTISPEKEAHIATLTEEELQALHGPRFERFCTRFARFCKVDYGLRFFYSLMAYAREKYPADEGISRMVSWTCLILQRIVEEYGHLVDQDDRSAPRIGVDLSKLMQPEITGRAICESMETNQSGALWWIIDEVGIWLYGY